MDSAVGSTRKGYNDRNKSGGSISQHLRTSCYYIMIFVTQRG